MTRKVNKFASLELAIRVLDLEVFDRRMCGLKPNNRSIRECPTCNVWHDNPNSEYCSYECTLEWFEVRDELRR